MPEEMRQTMNVADLSPEEVARLPEVVIRGQPRRYENGKIAFSKSEMLLMMKCCLVPEFFVESPGIANSSIVEKQKSKVVCGFTCTICGKCVWSNGTPEVAVEDYSEKWAFMSDELLELLYAEGSSQWGSNILTHMGCNIHVSHWFNGPSQYTSALGPVRGGAARHKTKLLYGNVPSAVPVWTKEGGYRLWRIPTREGCPLPTQQCMMQNIGDPRPMVALLVEEFKAGRVQLVEKDGQGRALRWANVNNLQVAGVRWKCDDLNMQYDADAARFISYGRMLPSGTDWLNATGNEAPSGVNYDPEYFSHYATEQSIREKLHPSVIPEKIKDVPSNSKRDMEGRYWRQYWDAARNKERCWYMVIRFDYRSRLTGVTAPFVSCIEQILCPESGLIHCRMANECRRHEVGKGLHGKDAGCPEQH
jgi:hypothetical protein